MHLDFKVTGLFKVVLDTELQVATGSLCTLNDPLFDIFRSVQRNLTVSFSSLLVLVSKLLDYCMAFLYFYFGLA